MSGFFLEKYILVSCVLIALCFVQWYQDTKIDLLGSHSKVDLARKVFKCGQMLYTIHKYIVYKFVSQHMIHTLNNVTSFTVHKYMQ